MSKKVISKEASNVIPDEVKKEVQAVEEEIKNAEETAENVQTADLKGIGSQDIQADAVGHVPVPGSNKGTGSTTVKK